MTHFKSVRGARAGQNHSANLDGAAPTVGSARFLFLLKSAIAH
jgi:hypothetical protein